MNGRLTVVRASVARLLAVMILFALPSSDSSVRAGWPNLPRRRPTSSRLSLSPVSLVDFTRIPFDFYLSSRSPPPRSFSFLDTRTSSPSLLRHPLAPVPPSSICTLPPSSVHTVKCPALIPVGKHCKFLLTRLLSRYRVKLVGSNDYRLRAVCSALFAFCAREYADPVSYIGYVQTQSHKV